MSTFSYPYRMAPPVRPSRSLEGLERVIPPRSPFSASDLFLNKPLPAKPLPEPEYSGMWSDSSDSESTLDSTGSSEHRNSADSYPIFVSSDSDFDDLVDHPTPPADQLLELSPQPQKRTDSIAINRQTAEPSSVASSFSETQYGRPSNWIPSRTGTSHYFREKKWDYFPELAPSALRASGRISPNMVLSKPRKMGNPLEFAKGKCRWHSLDRGGLGGVRDSIKTYVHRTLSRDSTDNKPKEIPRPATSPMDRHLNDVGGTLASTAPTPYQSSLALNTNIAGRGTSVATSSSSEYDYINHKFYLQTPISSTSPTSLSSPITPRSKQPAVPLSEYQKYGPAIWESPKSKKRNVQFPRYTFSAGSAGEPSSSSAPDLSHTNALRTLSRKQSRNNTRGVFLGAKKKIAESKDNRRREQLKAQIKLVGPINPHTYTQTDPWI